MAAEAEWTIQYDECQRNVNDLWFCKYVNYTVIWSLLCTMYALAAFIGK